MEEIKIVQLPPDRWKEYKSLRLEALLNDPQAFGQKYDKALNFPDSYWIEHLENTINKNKLLVYFAECKRKLIGMIGAFFHSNEETKDSARIFSVYVNKDFRAQGIAKRLQAHLLKELRNIRGLKKVKVLVNQSQVSAVRLYKQGGFRTIKTEIMVLGDGKKYEVDTLEQQLNNVAMKQSFLV